MNCLRIIAFAASWTGIMYGARPLIKAANLVDGEIVVSESNGGKPRQLTHDGRPKSLLVWSRSGDRIAFMTDVTDGSGAFATVKVISASGSNARAIPFRVPQPGVQISGMRFVEELQWIDGNRLALSGSMNPSTVQYAVIEIESGKEVDGFGADGFSLAVSPSGEHVAYESWVPHSQTEEKRSPQLCLDRDCPDNRYPWPSYPGPGRHVEFVTNPVWAPDGSAVAILVQDYKTSKLSLVVKPLRSAAVEYSLPDGSPSESLIGYNTASSSNYLVSWDRQSVLVKALETVWRLGQGESVLSRVIADDYQAVITGARERRHAERAKIEELGGTESDFWCKSCPLSRLPRRHGPYEETAVVDPN